jgi:hypothetical protein
VCANTAHGRFLYHLTSQLTPWSTQECGEIRLSAKKEKKKRADETKQTPQNARFFAS